MAAGVIGRVELGGGCGPTVPVPGWGVVVLDDPCCCGGPAPEAASGPTDVPPAGGLVATVRQRTRTGFDAEGVAEFDWATVLTAAANLADVRSEFDADAGLTYVAGTLSIAGAAEVSETAVVALSDGTLWRVTSVAETAGQLVLQVARIEQVPTGQPGS